MNVLGCQLIPGQGLILLRVGCCPRVKILATKVKYLFCCKSQRIAKHIAGLRLVLDVRLVHDEVHIARLEDKFRHGDDVIQKHCGPGRPLLVHHVGVRSCQPRHTWAVGIHSLVRSYVTNLVDTFLQVHHFVGIVH